MLTLTSEVAQAYFELLGLDYNCKLPARLRIPPVKH